MKIDPIFVMGVWRSGTTFLHELLSAIPGLLYPTTSQCMNPASFRLLVRATAGKQVTRPMDRFMIDESSPQEDEFALLALGVPSVYRGFFDPRRLDELSTWLEIDAWSAASPPGWLAIWKDFLGDVSAGSTGRLILKSPNHVFRIGALIEAMPNAAYVWIVRDPAEVFLSNRRMWTAMFQQYALWDWNERELDAFLLKALTSASRCLEYARKKLSTEQLAIVDFKSVTQRPVEILLAANSRLRLGDMDGVHTAVKMSGAHNVVSASESYAAQSVPAGAAIVFERLRATQCAALASHGV